MDELNHKKHKFLVEFPFIGKFSLVVLCNGKCSSLRSSNSRCLPFILGPRGKKKDTKIICCILTSRYAIAESNHNGYFNLKANYTYMLSTEFRKHQYAWQVSWLTHTVDSGSGYLFLQAFCKVWHFRTACSPDNDEHKQLHVLLNIVASEQQATHFLCPSPQK